MARLASGVRKRNNGLFEKRFSINGVRYSVYATTTKELAEKELQTRKQIEQGKYKTNNNIILDDYFRELLERKKIDTKENSLKAYNSIYKNHFAVRIGKYRVKEIERRQVLELQQEIAKEYTPTTVNYIMAVLKIILNEAVKDEIISRNPANGIKNIKAEKKATESYHRALSEVEQALFMQESKKSYYYELFALALCTGMRLGEIIALRWGDIDYKNNVIHVNKTQTYTLENKSTYGTPKTDAGNRDIPITSTIKQVLKKQYDKMGNIYSIDLKNSNIFISVYGKQIYKKLLGHSSIKMTMDLYAHVLPNTLQDEMQKIVINI